MTNDISSHNTGGVILKFLDIRTLLNNNYNIINSSLNKLKDNTDNDIIGFISQKYNTFTKIGRLDTSYNPGQLWFQQKSDEKLSFILGETKYSSLYKKNNTEWGPFIDTDNGEDDIYIYIGLKNSININL
tara:strand:- start:124 stop:513 length:390 start_codon:yes stop_codon:yes gene_type:complete